MKGTMEMLLEGSATKAGATTGKVTNMRCGNKFDENRVGKDIELIEWDRSI